MLVATIATIHVLSDAELATWGGSPVPSCPMMMASHAGQAAVGFPLQAMDIDVTAVGITATIELMQQFVNRSAVPMEATYIFPMPDRMAVRRFRMECNGRVIEGTIDERGAARAQYDHAIAQGQRAAIAEEERPGVFTMRVGNVMPGEAPIVRLSLVGPLGVDDGEVTLHFPLVVAPRYTAGNVLGGPQAGDGTAQDTDAVPDASRVAPPVRIAGHGQAVRLSGRVSFHGGQAGVSAVSTSLPMVVSPTDGTLQLNLANGQQLNRDLIVRWQLAGTAMTSNLTCVDDADGAAGTFSLLVIPPTSTTMAQRPRDVVFIVDRSGSMQGWQMVVARRAVARMVDSLNHNDRFAVMAFDDRIEQPIFDGGRALVVATDRNRFVAVEFLAKVDARGGTEMEQPLALAATTLAQSPMGRERVIVLATDGQITGEEQILGRLTPLLQGTRVFTIGIDRNVNVGFLRRLAGVGAGLFELVESEDRLDQVMSKIHGRIGMPMLSSLGIDGEGLAIDPRTVTPARLPDVYAGAPLLITGRYHGKASAQARVQLRGVQFGSEFAETSSQRVEQQSFLERYALASVWARARLRDLEDRYAAGGQSFPAREELEQEMIQLSKLFSVLCRFTAFVAVDRSEVANRTGYQQRVIQAVEQTESKKSSEAQPNTFAQTMTGVGRPPSARRQEVTGAPSGGALDRGRATNPQANANISYSVAAPAKSTSVKYEFDAEDESFDLASPSAVYAEAEGAPAGFATPHYAPAPSFARAPAAPPSASARPAQMSMPKSATPGSVWSPPPSSSTNAMPLPPKLPKDSVAPIDMSAYVVRLREIATALSAACANDQAMALRIEATRLRQWVDDASSTQLAPQLVAAIDAIARDIERLVRATKVDQAALAVLIASIGEVVVNSTATPPAPAPGPTPASAPRQPFWKRGSR